MTFVPQRVFFEKEALEYQLGDKLWHLFKHQGIEVRLIGSHNRVTGIPGKTPQEAYWEGKRTLVIGVRRSLEFASCKPSAHYQLPLCTSCAGRCEYCYLNTTLGRKPYLRAYVNIDEILEQARKYIENRSPEITFFEGAATSDPLPFEVYTGALAKTINFFAKEEKGRFRFVTKFTEVEPLLGLEHNGHTHFRFSLNAADVINKYEHGTPRMQERIEAAKKAAQANYRVGFLIAPVIIYPDWQKGYSLLLEELALSLPEEAKRGLSFEIITHRFTARAKKNILDVFPRSTLPMSEEERTYKYGQFGYGKYVYQKEKMEEIKDFFSKQIEKHFSQAELSYIV